MNTYLTEREYADFQAALDASSAAIAAEKSALERAVSLADKLRHKREIQRLRIARCREMSTREVA